MSHRTSPHSAREIQRRRTFLAAAATLVAAAVPFGCRLPPKPFPPEDTPEGAYARIALAVAEGRVRDVFPYLEDEAQWAAHTIQKERALALRKARSSFPAADLARLEAEVGEDARAADGADVFARIARRRGWITRLRRDLSGIARVERDGDRVTLVTAKGTRYPMRRRTVGIYGLTSFTADLADGAEKATRDRKRIEEAARDFAGPAPASADAGDAGGSGDAP
ncbi:MAG: hypothetical protein HYV09_21805 [Deltaproteobacteria bacterium]|nr:hypothetical protein [Deltaproteobacteria bacterium]